jgi:hypothetical protein
MRLLSTMFIVFVGLASSAQTANAQLKAVPLPDPQIPGYHFPEREATILGWISSSTGAPPVFDNIYLHGWGIWTSLTTETDQVIDGQKLRVFETWYTPEDLTAPAVRSLTDAAAKPRGRGRQTQFNQFRHGAAARARATARAAAGQPPVSRITGFVKYDPSAADHILSQNLLSIATLNSFLSNGANAIPPFTNTGVALKPVFQVITASQLKGGRYFPLPVWPGPPTLAKEFGPDQWPGAVWIDIQGGGAGKGDVDMTPPAQRDGSTRTDATTYPVSSLINYKLSADDAVAVNASGAASDAAAGDFSILLAMHVTTREITRWTWQTFWWIPTPDGAVAPSSSQIVAARPAQLKDSPRNYAMAIAYSTEVPAQPYIGGSNVGDSLYAYNPWLEAGFGPDTLVDSRPGYFQGQVVSNAFGVQTNCMSCHGSANFNPSNLPSAPNYTGDRYISLEDPRFAGTLSVDFLWSIPQHAK